MSFHYGQRVEVWWDADHWRPGTVDSESSNGRLLRVKLDDGSAHWADPFYIRPLEES